MNCTFEFYYPYGNTRRVEASSAEEAVDIMSRGGGTPFYDYKRLFCDSFSEDGPRNTSEYPKTNSAEKLQTNYDRALARAEKFKDPHGSYRPNDVKLMRKSVYHDTFFG